MKIYWWLFLSSHFIGINQELCWLNRLALNLSSMLHAHKSQFRCHLLRSSGFILSQLFLLLLLIYIVQYPLNSLENSYNSRFGDLLLPNLLRFSIDFSMSLWWSQWNYLWNMRANQSNYESNMLEKAVLTKILLFSN